MRGVIIESGKEIVRVNLVILDVFITGVPIFPHVERCDK